ncbi:unnamed protein product [Agarophyton chilense]
MLSCSEKVPRQNLISQMKKLRDKDFSLHQRQGHIQREGWRALPSAILGGGGFLGVGTSEVVVILLVGWLLLGPEKLFALAKDTGKILGELRSTANKAREQFDEAVELDLLAAEMKNKKSIEASKGSDNGMASMVDKLEDIGESEPLQTAELTKDLSSLGSSPDVAEALEEKSEEAGGDAFLDQLRRVSDPDQQAPIEIPDLEIDEEAEVKQLEEQYLYAKQRLERRKLEKQDRPEQNENKPVVRER